MLYLFGDWNAGLLTTGWSFADFPSITFRASVMGQLPDKIGHITMWSCGAKFCSWFTVSAKEVEFLMYSHCGWPGG